MRVCVCVCACVVMKWCFHVFISFFFKRFIRVCVKLYRLIPIDFISLCVCLENYVIIIARVNKFFVDVLRCRAGWENKTGSGKTRIIFTFKTDGNEWMPPDDRRRRKSFYSNKGKSHSLTHSIRLSLFCLEKLTNRDNNNDN